MPGTREENIYRSQKTREERFKSAQSETSSQLLFGHSYRAINSKIIIEDPRTIKNGFNNVIKHPAGPVEVKGFYLIKSLGNHQGTKTYRGSPVIVNSEKALATENIFSEAWIMLGSVENID